MALLVGAIDALSGDLPTYFLMRELSGDAWCNTSVDLNWEWAKHRPKQLSSGKQITKLEIIDLWKYDNIKHVFIVFKKRNKGILSKVNCISKINLILYWQSLCEFNLQVPEWSECPSYAREPTESLVHNGTEDVRYFVSRDGGSQHLHRVQQHVYYTCGTTAA